MNYTMPGTWPLPIHDYHRELQKAVSWLGDRYLLAKPQPRRSSEHPTYWTAQQHAAAHAARSTEAERLTRLGKSADEVLDKIA